MWNLRPQSRKYNRFCIETLARVSFVEQIEASGKGYCYYLPSLDQLVPFLVVPPLRVWTTEKVKIKNLHGFITNPVVIPRIEKFGTYIVISKLHLTELPKWATYVNFKLKHLLKWIEWQKIWKLGQCRKAGTSSSQEWKFHRFPFHWSHFPL
jgi:hypothetical protein